MNKEANQLLNGGHPGGTTAQNGSSTNTNAGGSAGKEENILLDGGHPGGTAAQSGGSTTTESKNLNEQPHPGGATAQHGDSTETKEETKATADETVVEETSKEETQTSTLSAPNTGYAPTQAPGLGLAALGALAVLTYVVLKRK